MKILVVTQYFWPEHFRINEICKDLVLRGHEVTVLTGVPNYPTGFYFEGYGLFGPFSQKWNGVTILRTPLVSRGNNKGLRLALNYLSFAVSGALLGFFLGLACWIRLFKKHFDVVLSYTPSPITSCLPGIVVSKLTGTRHILWVQDLWPESLSATKAVRSKKILAWVRTMVGWIYRSCDFILGQSAAFEPAILSFGVDSKKVSHLSGSADRVFEAPGSAPPEAVHQALQKIPRGFWVMFAGNLGVAQAIPSILEAANLTRHQPGGEDIHWIFLGDGRMAEEAKALALKLNLQNHVHFLGRFQADTMPHFFQTADVLLAALRSESIFSLTVPSRIHSYLAAGKPIAVAIDGEAARVVETEAKAGLSAEPENSEDLGRIILELKNSPPEALRAMGRNGKAYYDENLASDKILNRLEQLLEETAQI